MKNIKSFSNVPTSQPIFKSGEEKVTFNGFAWTKYGMAHQSVKPNPGNIQNWFGNN